MAQHNNGGGRVGSGQAAAACPPWEHAQRGAALSALDGSGSAVTAAAIRWRVVGPAVGRTANDGSLQQVASSSDRPMNKQRNNERKHVSLLYSRVGRYWNCTLRFVVYLSKVGKMVQKGLKKFSHNLGYIYGYQKTQNLCSYLCEKIHLKKVIFEKPLFLAEV
jgi:hypothetical protein